MQRISIAASLVLGFMALTAQAAQRTFVSTSGNDANAAANCSLTAPCRSFGAALTATDVNGEIVVQDSGGYGPVSIAQGVTITAPPGVYAGISVFSGSGVAISATGATVTLRGLTINGFGGARAIYAPSADLVRIDRCTINNFPELGLRADGSANRFHISDTVFDDTGGIAIHDASVAILERVRVTRGGANGYAIQFDSVRTGLMRDVDVIESTSTGIILDSSSIARSDVTLERLYVAESNGSGVSANAFGSGSTLVVTIRNSEIVRNSKASPLFAGISFFGQVASSFTRGSIESTVVAGNGDGISVGQSSGAALAIVSNSTIVDNTGFALKNGGSGAILYSRGNNTIRGNNGQETTTQNNGTITVVGGG